MKAFGDLTIRQKLTRVAMLTSLVAIAAAVSAFIMIELRTFRRGILREITVDAHLVATNTASALLFGDEAWALRGLAALEIEPDVVAAAVYDAGGRPFAVWSRHGGSVGVPGQAQPAGHSFEADELEVFYPVTVEGTQVGTVYVRARLSKLWRRQQLTVLVAFLVAVGSFGLALALSTRLQRAITGPLQRLADAARTISLSEDYSVRVPGGGRDEVGQLVGTFNEMLERVDRRDRELVEARETLEQRVAERTTELAQSQALLADAERLAHVGSWAWDVGRDEVTWSDEMFRLYGLEPTAVRPSYAAFLARIHPDDRARVAEHVERALRDGQPFAFEHRLVRPSGEVRALGAFGTVETAPDDRPLRLLGTAQDITERKAAEEERAQLIREQAGRAEAESARRRSAFLAEAAARLAEALDDRAALSALAHIAVPEVGDWCIVLLDGDGGGSEVLACAHVDPAREEALTRMARWCAEGAAGERAARPLVHYAPQEFPPFTSGDCRALLAEVGYSSGVRAPLQARRRRLGDLFLGTMGRPLGADDLDLVRSLADRAALFADNARLLREAQEANRLKDEFLATLSHELRTPLNAIVGWTKLLQSGELDEATAAKAVDTIDRNALAQAQLVEDILDVSRIVAGKLTLRVQPTDLAALAEGALDSVRHSAEAKGITVHASFDRVRGLAGDPDRLRQVVWNLLSNAVKFTPQGGNLWVSVREREGEAEIEVRDDGKGITPEFLPHVFDRFRQADASTTRRHGGLGLGLAIVRHLVELHGGTVSVASPGQDRGAAFTVRLPLPAGPVGESPVPAENVAPGA
ncbi:MAG TPA: ATP-binding protein [Vicinamibacteria bacterium]|jgi:PAS domain S-box-containing protein